MAVCIIIGFPEAVFTKNLCKIIYPCFPIGSRESSPSPPKRKHPRCSGGGPGPGERWSPRPSPVHLAGQREPHQGEGGFPGQAGYRILRRQTAPLWQGSRSPRVWGVVRGGLSLLRWVLDVVKVLGGVLFRNQNVNTVKVKKLHLKLWPFNLRLTKTIILEVVSSCVIKV